MGPHYKFEFYNGWFHKQSTPRCEIYVKFIYFRFTTEHIKNPEWWSIPQEIWLILDLYSLHYSTH